MGNTIYGAADNKPTADADTGVGENVINEDNIDHDAVEPERPTPATVDSKVLIELLDYDREFACPVCHAKGEIARFTVLTLSNHMLEHRDNDCDSSDDDSEEESYDEESEDVPAEVYVRQVEEAERLEQAEDDAAVNAAIRESNMEFQINGGINEDELVNAAIELSMRENN